VLGCGPTIGEPPEADGDGGAVATTTGMSDPDSGAESVGSSIGDVTGTTGADGSTSIGGSTDEGDEVGSDSGAGFIYGSPDTGTPPDECNLFDQDCPEGEKCAPFANDGGPAYNSNRCVVIDNEPDAVGEACAYEGSHLSGLDTCAPGAVCLPSTIDGAERHCVALCVGDPVNSICEDPTTTCVAPYGDHANFCLPGCDPLFAEMCTAGQACVPFGDDWACLPTQGLAPGEACESPNTCINGSICLPGDVLANCDGVGCCSSVCDLSEPDPDAVCLEGEQCQPYYDDPFFGQEDIGVCAAP